MSLRWSASTKTLPGQGESGDLHVVRMLPEGALVAVVDGLGHGPEAAAAAAQAVKVLESHAEEPVLSLLKRCHLELRSTRGVVMSLVAISFRDKTLTWTGVGDVEGVLLRADPHAIPHRECLFRRGGIVGQQLPLPHASIVSLTPGDTLILATDGVHSGFSEGTRFREHVDRMADRILSGYWKGTDDALVLVARLDGPEP